MKIFIFCTLFALLLAPFPTLAQTAHLKPIDAVLVLDVSLSMITADPNRIANEAMNMFIDMLETGRDRVGVVAYAGHITYSRELTLLTADNTAYIQNSIHNLAYASWTDHPLGLLEAIRIMYEGRAQDSEIRQPIIIFLTDGNFNINPYGARSVATADYDKATAIALAQQRGFPIYSIGLNFDGALDRRYFGIVAEATGGRSFETAHAEDLPDIINDIFYLMLHAAIPEPEPTIPVTEPPTTTEPPYIPQEIAPEYEEYETQRRLWQIAAAAFVAISAILFAITRGPKRVFTGRLIIEIVDMKNRISKPIIHRNLIEYGHHTTLQTLIRKEIPTALGSVIITPSPTAPSHLPQLLIKCKNPHVQLTKNFMVQDAHEGVEVNAGTEIVAACDDMHVRMRYVLS